MTDAMPYFDIESSAPHALRLVGELDAHAAERLDAVIANTSDGDVRLVIASPSPTVARLFDLSDVDEYLGIET